MGRYTLIYLFAAIAMVASSTGAQAQTLFIIENGTLTPFDIPTRKTGEALEELGVIASYAITPDGKKMYVTDVQHQEVRPIDLHTLHVGAPIGGPDDFDDPIDIAITPNGKKAYVVDRGHRTVKSIDLATNAISNPIGSFQDPHSIAIAPNGTAAYVTDFGNNGVFKIDFPSETIEDAPFGVRNPTLIVLSPDSAWAYVVTTSTNAGGGVVKINLETRNASLTVPVGQGNPVDLVISPDGKSLYTASVGPPEWAHLIAETMVHNDGGFLPDGPTPTDPGHISISLAPDGKSIFFGYDGQIDIVDASAGHTITRLDESGIENISAITPSFDTGFTSDVYFLGDSVTAGFGYCGAEAPAIFKPCNVNEPFDNAWTPIFGTVWPLSYCSPPETPDDRCSNNNVNGVPWKAAPWARGDSAPTIAYPFVIARNQSPAISAAIRNWAMTGAEPKHWDPGNERFEAGIFAEQLNKIRNSYVVMTVGANPILSDFLNINSVGTTVVFSKVGPCASKTQYKRSGATLAAALNNEAPNGDNGGAGLAHCFDEQWAKNNQSEHLTNIYQALLRNGNRVMVVGYPPVCPWSFGVWQPQAGVGGPASGASCETLSLPSVVPSAANPKGDPQISQADQAFYLADYANTLIQNLVEEQNDRNIVFVQPSADWHEHQYWTGQQNSWVFGNDTWVHPSKLGHEQIAISVLKTMCSTFQHWCPDAEGVATW